MKRSSTLIAAAFLTSLIAGCDGGLQEGPPPGPIQGTQTDEFRKSMERAGNKMMKGQMGKKAAAPITKAADPAAKGADPATKAP